MAAIPVDLIQAAAPPGGTAPAPAVGWGYVDDAGRLVLSPQMRRAMGLQPGARMRIKPDGNTLRLHRPPGHLAKVYIEPTDACNLDCVTCFRNAWQTSIGRMGEATFAAVLDGLQQIDPLPTVYFGICPWDQGTISL